MWQLITFKYFQIFYFENHRSEFRWSECPSLNLPTDQSCAIKKKKLSPFTKLNKLLSFSWSFSDFHPNSSTFFLKKEKKEKWIGLMNRRRQSWYEKCKFQNLVYLRWTTRPERHWTDHCPITLSSVSHMIHVSDSFEKRGEPH